MALALSLCGCGSRESGRDAAAERQARSQALIEAGNQAYGTGDFGLAARRYAAAAVVQPDDPAAHYGLGMAFSKLGRDEDARAAYARARELALEQQREDERRTK